MLTLHAHYVSAWNVVVLSVWWLLLQSMDELAVSRWAKLGMKVRCPLQAVLGFSCSALDTWSKASLADVDVDQWVGCRWASQEQDAAIHLNRAGIPIWVC